MMKRAFKASLVVSLLVLSTIVASISPFLTLGAMGDAPSEVWVDDDFDSSTTGWGVTRFDSVQDGVDAVASGGTVHVNSGTYHEDVQIKTSLTLEGEDVDTTVLQGTGSGRGVYVQSVTGVTISDLWIDGFQFGIYVWYSGYCTLTGNKLTGNTYGGLGIYSSDFGTVTGNAVEDNARMGIYMSRSESCTLRDNEISGNLYNFGVYAYTQGEYYHDIDSSNTVEGDPIYYWVGKSDATVPKDAGFVGLFDCDNITAKNLDISNNYHGILLFQTMDSTIKNVEVANCEYGIYLDSSEANTLWGNTVSDTLEGIILTDSPSNALTGNTVSNSSENCIDLGSSDDCVLTNNRVTGAYYNGIRCDDSSSLTLFNNRAEDNRGDGIRLQTCDSSTVTNNKAKGNGDGIFVYSSTQVTMSSNKVRDNVNYGMELWSSQSCTLRENIMSGNRYNFGVYGYTLLYLDHDIDTSNTVDGKPVYYWVGRSYATIPSDAGYVCVVDSDHVTVQDLTLTNNFHGVFLAYTTDSTIDNVEASNTLYGIQLYRSGSSTVTSCSVTESGIQVGYSPSSTVAGNTVSSIVLSSSGSCDVIENVVQDGGGIRLYGSGSTTVTGNTVTGCGNAIFVDASSSCSFIGNTVKDNYNGYWDQSNSNLVRGNTFQNNDCYSIYLTGAKSTTVTKNTIQDSKYGISLSGVKSATITENVIKDNNYGIRIYSTTTTGNSIYYNDFIDNVDQLYSYPPLNQQTWDDGSGMGNHWSDYAGEDTDDDGVGDTLLPHLGADGYPLMEPYN